MGVGGLWISTLSGLPQGGPGLELCGMESERA